MPSGDVNVLVLGLLLAPASVHEKLPNGLVVRIRGHPQSVWVGVAEDICIDRADHRRHYPHAQKLQLDP